MSFSSETAIRSASCPETIFKEEYPGEANVINMDFIELEIGDSLSITEMLLCLNS